MVNDHLTSCEHHAICRDLGSHPIVKSPRADSAEPFVSFVTLSVRARTVNIVTIAATSATVALTI